VIARIVDPALDRLLNSWHRDRAIVRGASRPWLLAEIMLADASLSKQEAEAICEAQIVKAGKKEKEK